MHSTRGAEGSSADRTPSLVIVTAAFAALSTAVFATRLVWRAAQGQRGWEDVGVGAAYGLLVVQTACGLRAAHCGFGRHRADLAPDMFEAALFWFWLYQICYKLLGGCTKLAFCTLYLHLFARAKQRVHRLIFAVAAIVAFGSLGFALGTVLQCRPVRRNWDRQAPGRCVSFVGFWYAHAAFNTLLDIVVFVLPIPLLRRLQVARRTRLGLISIFALGAFTIAASVVRMLTLRHSAGAIARDPTWGSTTALIWTAVEANTAVICCCMPALRLFAVRVWSSSRHAIKPQSSPPHDSPQLSVHPVSPPPLPHLPSAPPPAHFKSLGTFSQARYSPPPSPPPPSPDHVRGRLLFGRKRCSSPPSSLSLPPRSVPSAAPQIYLPGLDIYRSHVVEVRSHPVVSSTTDPPESI